MNLSHRTKSQTDDQRIVALEQELALRTAERDRARHVLERRVLDAAAVPNPDGHAMGARLFAAITELQHLSEELEQRNAALAQANWELERRVEERTAALEAALDAKRRSEARFRAVADGVPQLVWSSHPEGRWDFSNKRWQAYTGQTEAETMGLGWLDRIHPDDRRPTMDAWHEATRRSGPMLVEHRIRGQDGKYRWFETQALPSGARPGNPEAAWVGSSTDVHARKLAEAALAETRRQLERELEVQRRVATASAEQISDLFTISSDALFIVKLAPEGRWRHEAMNPPFERLTGVLADQARGKEAREFLTGEAAAALEAGYRACAEAGELRSFDASLVLPSGRRTLRITLIPMRAGAYDGPVQHILGVARDIGNAEPSPA